MVMIIQKYNVRWIGGKKMNKKKVNNQEIHEKENFFSLFNFFFGTTKKKSEKKTNIQTKPNGSLI